MRRLSGPSLYAAASSSAVPAKAATSTTARNHLGQW